MDCNDQCGFGIDWSSSSSNFTCSQVISYCQRYTKTFSLCDKLKATVDYTHILFGTVGFFCYIIMHLMYRMKSFNAASFIYHRSMVYMEFVHMIVMIQSGILMSRGFADTHWYVWYRTLLCEMWIIGDAMKLCVAILTTFLSFERTMAIWNVKVFNFINRKSVARSLSAISLIFGILHFSPVISGHIVPVSINSTLYTEVDDYTGQKVNMASWYIIYGLKIGLSVIIMVFCVAIVIGLVSRSKKNKGMVTSKGNDAEDKWKETKRLCAMQLVMAVSCLIDHTVWVINKLLKYETVYYLGSDAVTHGEYDAAVLALDNRLAFHVTWVIESMSGEIDHGCRLFIYLACVKSFRSAFKTLIKCKGSTVTTSKTAEITQQSTI